MPAHTVFVLYLLSDQTVISPALDSSNLNSFDRKFKCMLIMWCKNLQHQCIGSLQCLAWSWSADYFVAICY